MTLTFLLLAPLFLAAPQENAGPPVVFSPGFEYSHQLIRWPDPEDDPDIWENASGTFSESAVGRIIPRLGASAVFLREKSAFVLDGVDATRALSVFNSRTRANMDKVNALVITEGEWDGDPDHLVTGCTRYGYSDQLHLQDDGFDFTTVPFLSSPEARQTTIMRAVDIDGVGRKKDFIGVSGSSVLVFRRQGGAWVQGTTITANGPVYDAIVFDYNGLPGNKIGLMKTNAIEVRSLGGSLIEEITMPGTIKAIASVPPMPSSPPHNPWDISERLVIVCDDPGPGDGVLHVRNSIGATQSPQGLVLSPYEDDTNSSKQLDVTWLHTFDFNKDQQMDLALTQRDLPMTVILYRNAFGNYNISNEAFVERIPFEREQETGDVSANFGQPVFWTPGPYARNTLLRPVESLGRNVPPPDAGPGIAIAATPASVAVDPNIIGLGYIGSSGSPVIHSVKYGLSNNDLTIRLSPPAGTAVDTDIWAQVTFWEQPYSTEGSFDPLLPTGGHAWLPLDTAPGLNVYKIVVPLDLLAAQLNGEAPDVPSVPLNEDPSEGSIYWAYVRIIQVELYEGALDGYDILDESDWAHIGFRMQPVPVEEDTPFYDAVLQGQPYVTAFKRLIADYVGGGGGGAEFGAVILTDIGGGWPANQLPAIAEVPYHP